MTRKVCEGPRAVTETQDKMGPVQTLHFSDTPAVDMTSEQTAFSSSKEKLQWCQVVK